MSSEEEPTADDMTVDVAGTTEEVSTPVDLQGFSRSAAPSSPLDIPSVDVVGGSAIPAVDESARDVVEELTTTSLGGSVSVIVDEPVATSLGAPVVVDEPMATPQD